MPVVCSVSATGSAGFGERLQAPTKAMSRREAGFLTAERLLTCAVEIAKHYPHVLLVALFLTAACEKTTPSAESRLETPKSPGRDGLASSGGSASPSRAPQSGLRGLRGLALEPTTGTTPIDRNIARLQEWAKKD